MSNQPPIEVPQGAIRLNTDSQRLEFFAQDRWYEMATDTPNLGNSPVGVRGLFAGRFNDSSNNATIDYITISSQGNATDYGDLINSIYFYAGMCSSNRRWVHFGGAPTNPSTQMQYGQFASTGNGVDFGNLTQHTHYNPSGVSNQTRGVRMGGAAQPTGSQNNIEYWTFETLSNSIDFGDLGTASRFAHSANSPTRGMIHGGNDGPNGAVTSIQFVTISTLGNAQTFGDVGQGLPTNDGGNGACSNATRGLFAGGVPGYVSTVATVQMATLGDSYEFGDLSVARGYVGSTASATRAVFGGGYYSSPSATYVNTIDYMNIATGGTATDFGDRTVQGSYLSASSNGHGGL
mgnify:FL=1